MASFLRQIVAGPRSRHPEAGLDLCYVTDNIIATSGPSGTYPQRAYRNPLDQLVKFLDYKHGKDWAIWEFRAEGTGYPDEEVYGRVWHYPWPDHHPPPFRLVPLIMASMRNWLHEDGKEKKGRVVVVHCKAGKGRSGTMATSYLISECGWKPSEALARFTERRMRPGFGQGVSIPSQLRWIGYVDRWTHGEKIYVERQIEVCEVHIWGLRDGVKVAVEGYVEEGKVMKVFHIFTKHERTIVEGNAPGSEGLKDKVSELAGFESKGKIHTAGQMDGSVESTIKPNKHVSTSTSKYGKQYEPTGHEKGGNAVIFKPSSRVILPTSDINIDFERRNKATMGWTMVTAVAHVWFNCFFEGNGPEQQGKPDDNGVFEIDWDKMDGLKGSSRKGTRSFDRMSVVWKVFEPEETRGRPSDVIHEPGENSPVPQMAAADWRGDNAEAPGKGKELGLRTESPTSTDVSKASSIVSPDGAMGEKIMEAGGNGEDDDSFTGVRSSGPAGEENVEDIDVTKLPQPKATGSGPDLSAVNAGLDTASHTTPNASSTGTPVTQL